MLKEIFSLFFPRRCYGCGISLTPYEQFICEYCKFDLPLTNYHLVEDNPVEQRFWGKVMILKGTSLLFYNKKSIVQSIIHSLKYKKSPEIGVYFGRLSAYYAPDFFVGIDYIIPVPLHEKKLKARGYNQSEMIAVGLSQVTTIPICHNLKRIKYTDTQTHKDQFQRFENTKDSFVLENAEEIAFKTILLIDDVLTTGSTLEACAKAIISADKDIKICVFTLGLAQ